VSERIDVSDVEGIETAEVEAVLLPDGWHNVEDFFIDEAAQRFKKSNGVLFEGFEGGGPGFTYMDPESGRYVSGPMSSLLAVAYRNL
jgi:hypothetical protein